MLGDVIPVFLLLISVFHCTVSGCTTRSTRLIVDGMPLSSCDQCLAFSTSHLSADYKIPCLGLVAVLADDLPYKTCNHWGLLWWYCLSLRPIGQMIGKYNYVLVATWGVVTKTHKIHTKLDEAGIWSRNWVEWHMSLLEMIGALALVTGIFEKTILQLPKY